MSKIPEMTASERFKAYLSGKEVDRAPAVEWAPWWHLTVNRWLEDGLPVTPQDMSSFRDISDWTNAYRQA